MLSLNTLRTKFGIVLSVVIDLGLQGDPTSPS